ncbi:hypothetical protein GCM10022289_24880 [Pedobacter jeongneungensis]|uniref:ParB/Sulfiredoxin domain-containing protein n=1 Tax=Pedobacter jeongneungensis TaxID=947309 RepID=A0ABP8BF80_9SPHI
MGYINSEIISEYLKSERVKLLSTHNKLSIPIINRMYRKMVNGINFDNIKVCDNLIIDGHHRYISSILADIDLGWIPSCKTSATNVYDWTNVEFVDEEWDTELKIQRMNELDAEFNNISIEKISEITK